MRTPLSFVAGSALLLAASACTQPEGAAPPLSGAELYAACAACHGDQAQGNASLGAPPIAALPEWYLLAQLTKFRIGARGAHPDDYEGLRMRPMARQLLSEAELVAVSKHVAGLTRPPQPATLTGGDAAAGAASWGVCLACHGPQAQGNPAMFAPPLQGQADWYLFTQLKKFKAGVRGTNPLDVSGGTMRPMSLTLADEQAMKDVLAHVATLKPN